MKSGKKQTLLTMPERDVLENVRYMRFAFGESLLAGFSHKKKYKDFENFRNPTLVLVLVLLLLNAIISMVFIQGLNQVCLPYGTRIILG